MADAPTTPGTWVGQSQNGYFWNGTSWDQGETVSGTTTPAVPATPAASTVPAPATSSAKRPSILATIMRNESGGRNVPQRIDDINMRNGDPAQGYYQITGGTWHEFGGGKAGHKSALDAPYATQLQIAQNIPVARWGPATQQALKAAGYEPKPGETLGEMLARYNEDPTATRPEDVGGSSAGGTATTAAAPTPPSPAIPGLLGASTSAPADVAAASAQQSAQQKANAALMQQGTGLLGQTTPAVPFMQMAGVHRPQAEPVALPSFTQVLAQQRLKQGQGM